MENKMLIQEVVFFSPKDIDADRLYLHKTEGVRQQKEDGSIYILAGNTVSFDTYFNCFSIRKWKKYTVAKTFSLVIAGEGDAEVSFYGSDMQGDACVRRKLNTQRITLAAGELSRLVIPSAEDVSVIDFEIHAVSDSVIFKLAYEADETAAVNETAIAIDICTFKREPYLKRNIEALSERILNRSESVAYGAVEVYISDNAGTLGTMFDAYSSVHVSVNENTGGVGGFTRGIIEASNSKRAYTHILLMDDDAIVDPAVVERTCQFLRILRPEYKNSTIGGSLLRQNIPCVQYELGADWNRGKIKTNYHHLSLDSYESVVQNEVERSAEYCGWWYSCIPCTAIENAGLPLPIFIHRDDTEYGMRTGADFIFLNGIAIWHEAFENKMPGATEYYDIRNLAIVNSIHYPDYSKREFKRILIKWVSSNIARYRYQYIDMNLRGVEDFLKGIDWLKAQDGTLLHKEILGMNYRAQDVAEYAGYKNVTEEAYRWENLEKLENKPYTKLRKIGQLLLMNGYFLPKKHEVLVAGPHDNIYEMFRAGEILYVDAAGKAVLMKRDGKRALGAYIRLAKIIMQINRSFDIIRQEYRERYEELTSESYWNHYLKLSEEKHE